MTIYSLLITTLHLVTVSILLASENATGQSLNEVALKFETKGKTLEEVFEGIEENTQFSFVYVKSQIPENKKITENFGNENLQTLLQELANEFRLEFRRINNQIVVKRSEKPVLIEEVFYEQESTISGKVTDTWNGEPLVGVNVLVKETTIGTITDVEGFYKLDVPNPDAILIFSYIGYESEEVAVGQQSVINVSLYPDIRTLEDIVVIGYGTQQKKDVTGAISQVSMDNLSSRNVNNASEYIQGYVPGVTIQNNGGDPTATPTIRIRGMGSINPDEGPLWIVDGVPYGGPPINPADIESISILKDASVAAIYGARAASGIIMVTTKKGEEGKAKVNVNVYAGVQNAWKTLQPLNAAEFADIRNLATDNAGQPRDPAFDVTANPDARITKTDWMDEIFRTGTVQNYDLTISGGNKSSTYLVSGGFRKNEGILLNTHSERYSFRVNSDHKINDRLTIGENLVITHANGNGANTTSPYTGAILTSIFYPPNATVYKEDGSGEYGGVPEDYAGSYGDVINPVAYLERLDYSRPQTTIFGNAYAEIKLVKNLKYKFNLGYTMDYVNTKDFQVRVLEPGKKFFDNNLYMQSGLGQQLLLEHTLNYTKSLGKHNLDGLLGYTFQKNTSEYFNVQGRDFDSEDPEARYLDNAKTIVNEGTYGGGFEDLLIGYIGRLMYSYNEKYFLTAFMRRDGSSRLAADKRWQWSPGATAGWRIGDESFMEPITLISDMKLRASWGKTGNIGVLPYYPTYVALSSVTTILGESPETQPGFIINGIANPELVWEKSEQYDLGLDLGLLENRLEINADYFIKYTTDMLMKKPITALAGVSQEPWINGGKVKNQGLELMITFRDNEGDFTYSFSGNIATIKNELVSLPIGESIVNYPSVRATLYPTRSEVGQPLFSYYGLKTDGIFRTQEEVDSYVGPSGELLQPYAQPGDLKFVNTNGDDQINDNDKIFLGNPFPSFTYGLNASFGWKQFDLNLLFQGVSGIEIFNAMKYTTLNAGIQGYNMLEDVKDAWSTTNQNSDIPRVSANDPNNNFGSTSDFYIENGSYLRLKNITLGYTLPAAPLEKAGLGNARIYFTSSNLLTFTNYSGFDPEVGLDVYGVDNGRYPQARSFILGLNLSF